MELQCIARPNFKAKLMLHGVLKAVSFAGNWLMPQNCVKNSLGDGGQKLIG